MPPPRDPAAAEIASFAGLWRGGYYEGDPLDPYHAGATYRGAGFVSALYATYCAAIRPYVTPDTVALEIGPGRGAWTKTLLPAREVWALDALSAEHNGIHDYLGHPAHLHYHQVHDFSCSMLPDGHFDYVFSFGCLCHVSFEGITAYAQNLRPKLKPGAHLFWMVADYAKFNASVEHADPASLWDNVIPPRRRFALLRHLFLRIARSTRRPGIKPNAHGRPSPGRWYDAGAARTTAMLRDLGYQVLDPDIGTSLRDPIIHFRWSPPADP